MQRHTFVYSWSWIYQIIGYTDQSRNLLELPMNNCWAGAHVYLTPTQQNKRYIECCSMPEPRKYTVFKYPGSTVLQRKRPSLDCFVLFTFQFTLMAYHKEVLPRHCSTHSKLFINIMEVPTNCTSKHKAVKLAATSDLDEWRLPNSSSCVPYYH